MNVSVLRGIQDTGCLDHSLIRGHNHPKSCQILLDEGWNMSYVLKSYSILCFRRHHGVREAIVHGRIRRGIHGTLRRRVVVLTASVCIILRDLVQARVKVKVDVVVGWRGRMVMNKSFSLHVDQG